MPTLLPRLRCSTVARAVAGAGGMVAEVMERLLLPREVRYFNRYRRFIETPGPRKLSLAHPIHELVAGGIP